MSLAIYWWKPYDTSLNTAISLRRFHRAWFAMARRRLSFTNFGDAANEPIFRELAARSVKWAPLAQADLVGIGSILDLVERSTFSGAVLGSGIRAMDLKPGRLKVLNLLSVRGAATATMLDQPDLPFGDPGLVVREVFPAPRGRSQWNMPVVIPHYGDLNSRSGRDLLQRFHSAGWRVVLPNNSPAMIAALVASAPVVASSSLHGLVFAHSFGVPAVFVDFEATDRPEPMFKYRDYYSVFGLEPSPSFAKEVLTTSLSSLIDAKEPEHAAIAARVDGVIDGIFVAARPLRSGA